MNAASSYPNPDRATTARRPASADDRDAAISAEKRNAAQRRRYGTLTPVARGGTADVYRSHDRVLGREVALKLLRHGDARQVKRLEREARALAAVHHPCLCPVYDVGTFDGTPYLAMGFVDGVELTTLRLSPTAAARLMARAADGIDALHRAGLVHRDLKPENILAVDDGEDGALRPMVIDLGLVHVTGTIALTRADEVLGTPAYMAPEQLRGGGGGDQRTDVYGLGATLYALLLGRPPHVGSTFDILHAVQRGTHAPDPHALDPDLPRDLAAIVRCATAPRPDDRYPSAAALAADLRRFVADQPILARRARPSKIRRVLGRARRRSGVAAALILLTLLTAILIALQGWRSRTQRTYAQRYDAAARDVEGMARAARMSAIHDIEGSHARIRQRLETLEASLPTLLPWGRPLAHAALGRGHLALRDDHQAIQHLERALALGNRAPEVALALALALGRQHRDKLDAVDPASGLGERPTQTYRARIRALLTRGRRAALLGDSGTPAYVDALLATYDQRYDDALHHVIQARRQRASFYEADILEGDIRVLRAVRHQRNNRFEAARRDLDGAADAYRIAIDAASSDIGAYVGLCRTAYTAISLVFSMYQAPTEAMLPELQRFLDEVHTACSTPRQLNPDSPQAWILPARAVWHSAIAEDWYLDRNPRADLLRGLAALEEGKHRYRTLRATAPARADPDHIFTLDIVTGDLLTLYGSIPRVYGAGNDPRPHLDRAVLAYQRALLRDPTDAWTHNLLGQTYSWRQGYEALNGLAAERSARMGMHHLQRALALLPDPPPPHADRASMYDRLGQIAVFLFYSRLRAGEPIDDIIEGLITPRLTGLALRPDDPMLLLGTAEGYEAHGYAIWLRGGDPLPALRQAVAYTDRAVAILPEDPYLAVDNAQVQVYYASLQIIGGRTPAEALASAADTVDALASQALSERMRRSVDTLRVRHGTQMLRWWLLLDGPAPDWTASDRALEQIRPLADAVRHPFTRQQLVEHLLWRTLAEHLSGRNAAASLDEAARGVTLLMEAGHEPARRWAERSVVERLRALLATDPAQREAHLAAAATARYAAVTANPWLDRELDTWDRLLSPTAVDPSPRVLRAPAVRPN